MNARVRSEIDRKSRDEGHPRTVLSPVTSASTLDGLARALYTLMRRIQADLDRMEPIVKRLEALARAGTHGDLPGNGQSD